MKRFGILLVLLVLSSYTAHSAPGLRSSNDYLANVKDKNAGHKLLIEGWEYIIPQDERVSNHCGQILELYKQTIGQDDKLGYLKAAELYEQAECQAHVEAQGIQREHEDYLYAGALFLAGIFLTLTCGRCFSNAH